MTPLGAIVASIAAVLMGPRLLTLLLSLAPERYVPSAGVQVPLMLLLIVVSFVVVTQAFFALHVVGVRLRQVGYDRINVHRAIVRQGDRDIDAWIDEGLVAYGSINRVALAGILSGLLLPWLTVVLGGYLYSLATHWYADSFLRSLRGSIGPSLSISDLWIHLFLGAYGGMFAITKRESMRRRIYSPFGKFAWFFHPHVTGTLVGALFFLLLGALPQSSDSRDIIIMIVIIAPVWLALGFALNIYFHFFHSRLLRLLYLKDWPGAVRATTRRLIIGHLDVKTPCSIRADDVSGRVHVDHFPAGKGSTRLVELVTRIPGVEGVLVQEYGERRKAKSGILTIYTGLGDSAKPVRILQTARWFPLAGGAVGAVVFVVGTAVIFFRGLIAGGLAYALTEGSLWTGQAQLLKQGVIVGVVGWAIGFAVHRAVRATLQRRLPGEFRAALAEARIDMADFRPGDVDSEVHVTADLTRVEAIRLLGPIAAKYGVGRILLTTSVDLGDLAPNESAG